jgi:hypothetical protein
MKEVRFRRTQRSLAVGAATILAVAALAACGGSAHSSSAPTDTTKVASTVAPSSGPPSSTTVPSSKDYLKDAGTGNKALGPVTLPATWTITWSFDCGTLPKGTFVLTSADTAAAPVTLTNQTGLGGGGHKPFSTGGSYRFAVTTTCHWTVTVGPTPPAVPVTTTTAVGG